ncbi:MAG: DUF2892 domain-containing protein [Acidobacteria bacterium]|nr:MAG: DUF2892 domain-containing protein [Acidobacteriota bacterium]
MDKNVGTADRVARVIVGLVLLALVFVIEGPWRWIGLIGIVPLATAALGTCPLYTLLGIRTCQADKS